MEPQLPENFVNVMFKYEMRAVAGTLMRTILSDDQRRVERYCKAVEKITNRTPVRLTIRGIHRRFAATSIRLLARNMRPARTNHVPTKLAVLMFVNF